MTDEACYKDLVDARAELKADVAVMRELGVTHWKDIVLGSTPGSAEPTQQPKTPEQIVKESREQREALMRRASGGPVKPLGGFLR